MNTEHFQNVLDHISKHPETWDQTNWHCGTTHCFAGWAQILSGKKENTNTVRIDARIYLDISYMDANYLFCASRSIIDFQNFLDTCSKYTRDGYDRDGYDRNGYDRNGYDRNGYDRNGYDRDGYDRDGYDRNGYDRDGYDRNGYDRDGYDRDGLDTNNQPKP